MKYEQADAPSCKAKQLIKKIFNKRERRRAKLNPECQPLHKQYNGYQT